jgi:hypothetical protein
LVDRDHPSIRQPPANGQPYSSSDAQPDDQMQRPDKPIGPRSFVQRRFHERGGCSEVTAGSAWTSIGEIIPELWHTLLEDNAYHWLEPLGQLRSATVRHESFSNGVHS